MDYEIMEIIMHPQNSMCVCGLVTLHYGDNMSNTKMTISEILVGTFLVPKRKTAIVNLKYIFFKM